MDYISLILCVLHKTNSFQNMYFYTIKKEEYGNAKKLFYGIVFPEEIKAAKNGEAPICMRITINGKRAEVQIKRSIDVTKWNTQKNARLAGKEVSRNKPLS